MAFDPTSELPSYMYAADIHNVANGKESMVDSPEGTTLGDTVDVFTKGIPSTIARAITSTVNIVPAATNWAGLTDIPEWQTEDLLATFDDDLAAYYSQHRDTIDVVGDIAASMVPGIAGVKMLNYGQKALKGLSRGSAGKNILQSVGMLPDMTAKYATEGMAKMMSSGNTFNMVESNVLKSFGTAYAQNALEAAAFETAAAVSMGDRSPLFKDHTALDIVYNSALGGGIVGAGILGTVSGIKTYGAVKGARDLVDRAMAPFRFVKATDENVPDFVKLLNAHSQLKTEMPALSAKSIQMGETELKVSTAAASRAFENQQRKLGLEVQDIATRIAGGDAEIGKALSKSFKDMEPDQVWAASLHMSEVSRAGLPTKLDAVIEAANTSKQALLNTEGMSAREIAKHEAFVKNGQLSTLKYLDLDSGIVTITPPQSLGLADMYTGKELEAQVRKVVGKEGVPGIEWNTAEKTVEQTEARYIHANMQTLQSGVRIDGLDLPYLEAAKNQGVKEVIVNGMSLDQQQLTRHLLQTKQDMMTQLYRQASVDPELNTAKIARILDMDVDVVEAGELAGNGVFARTSLKDFTEPKILKIAYKGDPETVGVSGDVLSGMAQIKQIQEVTRSQNLGVVNQVIGAENAAMIPLLKDVDILSSTSAGAGAGLLTFASGNYQTLASKVEWMGKLTNRLKTEAQKEVNDLLQPAMYKILQNPDAGTELATLRQTILSTGEKYILREGELVHKDVAAYERKMDAYLLTQKGQQGIPPTHLAAPELPAGVAESIKIKNAETLEFLSGWIAHNDKFSENRRMLKGALGKDISVTPGELYFPQPDSRKFPYFSMVVPKNPAENEKVQMLWAASPQELANLESKVPADYSILRKADTETFHKAVRDYDYDLGFHSGQMQTELKRSGVAAPFFPKTEPQVLLQEMLDWKHRMSDMNVRDAVSLQNQIPFSELKRLDSEYVALQKSTKGANVKVDSPYSSYVSTALDIPRTSSVPVWTEFNNLAENIYTKVIGKLKDTWGGLKSPEELTKVNDALGEAGIKGFSDAMTELWANHPASGKELSKHIMAANGVFSTFMLRADPMNALNNGVGSIILTGSETSNLVKKIKSLGGDFDTELMQKAFVGVPGSSKAALSPVKLISAAYADWAKLVMDARGVQNNPQLRMLEEKFNRAGFMPSMIDQMRSVADDAILNGMETAGQLESKTKAIMKGMGNFAEKWTGNKSVEEMNRFVSAHIADSLSSIAVKGGAMTEAEQLAFVNTFVNRTQGNYLASQRPLMFQGPVGHAISLFQTYSFNMMQHMFRSIESGDKKQLGILLGLQTSVFGMNGLPGFDFMNRTLVGMAAGNTSNRDITSSLQDTGHDVGNWLLYGSLSNATGLGLYSRGDLNPRHMTILPSSIGDVPIISATRQVLGSLVSAGEEMIQGADIGSTTLRALEHANISRPLAGLATTLQGLGNDAGLGYSTSGKNGVMYAWDMYSMQTIGRLAGARPLDEAIVRDAYHRVQVYDSQRAAQVAVVGSAIRDKVRGGYEVTEDDVNQFAANYAHAGGDQKTFMKFMQANIKKADTSQVNSMVSNLKKPGAQYLQQFLHGASIEDLREQQMNQN